MSEKYKEQVEFILVYIREAHATDGWQSPRNEREGILLETAKTMDQKEEYATSCARKLDIRFTTLVDAMDNAVEEDYAGFPDRLYLLDKAGVIRYKSAPGPQGFKPAELEAAIKRELGLE
jgi:hypothetical protein